MKIWIKISSENRNYGAWFYDLEYARQHAKYWERLIPVEFPDWPNTEDDNIHTQHETNPDNPNNAPAMRNSSRAGQHTKPAQPD